MEPIGNRQEVDAKEQAEREDRAKRDPLKQQRTESSFAQRMQGKPTPLTGQSVKPQAKPGLDPESQPNIASTSTHKPAQRASSSEAAANRTSTPGSPLQETPDNAIDAHQREGEAASDAASAPQTPEADTPAPTLPGIPPTSINPRLQPGVAAPAGQAPLVTPQQLQEIVRYAAVGTNAQGQAEFSLGLTGAVAGGLQICLTALGQRRVKMRLIKSASDGPADGQIHDLVEALRSRGIEVVEVESE